MSMKVDELQSLLSDALAERRDLDTYIIGLQARIRSLGALPSEPLSLALGGFTIVDRCEELLRRAGRPLDCTVMVHALEKSGRSASYNSVKTALLHDQKDRFEKLRPGCWALREWPEEVKGPYRKPGKQRGTITAQEASPITVREV